MRVAQFATALLVIAVGAARAQAFDLKWGGLINDGFTLDGEELWTVEDGGRIRHRVPTSVPGQGVWSYANLPTTVKDTLRRVHFLSDGVTGWAVCADGRVLKSVDGGANWTVLWRQPSLLNPTTAYEDLWDVFFLNDLEGWIVGTKGIWFTATGGAASADWTHATLPSGIDLDELELYSLDVSGTIAGGMLALASGEPGLILRATTPLTFEIVLDACDPQHDQGLVLPDCMSDACDAGQSEEVDALELWDIKISHNASPLALCLGGAGNDCGIALASHDNGLTWVREFHECQCVGISCPCNGNPDYTNNGGAGETWRLRTFRTLYGVSIFHGTNEAIGCGYKGQALVRDVLNGTGGAGVWRDRSVYSDDMPNAPNCVIFPMLGAVTASNSTTSTRGYITGEGGYIRQSADATSGQQSPWTTADPACGAWRTRDVWFSSANDGWVVGQFSRIASTPDGGVNWAIVDPQPDLDFGYLNAITFAPGNQIGVAVGELEYATNMPKILVTGDGGTTAWQSPDSVSGLDEKEPWNLYEVTWSGTSHFWAVGEPGLILHSSDDGVNWNAFVPPGVTAQQFNTFAFEGVAFHDQNNGVFVGTKGGNRYAAAYNVAGNTVSWNELSIGAFGANAKFMDVDISGGVAYIVAEDRSLASPLGYLLTSTLSGTTWSALTVVATVPACTIAIDPDVIEPILEEVEIDTAGLVWIGGECGRLWSWTASGGLMEHKTETDASVRGISFYGSAAGYRTGRTQQSIVEIH